MSITYSKTAMTQTFSDVQAMCHTLCNQYKGGVLSIEELESTAYWGFLKAYHTHNANKSEFTTWCWFSVLTSLQDEIREKCKRLKRIINSDELLLSIIYHDPEEKRKEFNEWVSSLDSDCRKVIRILTKKYPDSMQRQIAEFGKEDGDTIRNALRLYLETKKKWKRQRVLDCFKNIRQALKTKGTL